MPLTQIVSRDAWKWVKNSLNFIAELRQQCQSLEGAIRLFDPESN